MLQLQQLQLQLQLQLRFSYNYNYNYSNNSHNHNHNNNNDNNNNNTTTATAASATTTTTTALHYTRLDFNYNYDCSYSFNYHYTATTTATTTTITLRFATRHCILQLWVRWPLQPRQKSHPPFGPSMDSLCHPCITTTHLSYSFLSLKLPPPCAVLLLKNVAYAVHTHAHWMCTLIVWHPTPGFILFPTWQVRVSRFIRVTSSFLLLLLPAANSRSQWALPGLIRELQMSVGTAGPHPPAPDVSGHCRTSTASSISVGTAGPQRRAPDVSGHCRASTASARSQWAQKECQNKCQIECQKECQQSLYARKIQKVCQNRCQMECLKECQSICQKERQILYPVFASRCFEMVWE